MMTKSEKAIWELQALLAENDSVLVDLLLQLAILEMETGVTTDVV